MKTSEKEIPLTEDEKKALYRYHGYKKKTHDTRYGPVNIRSCGIYMFKDKMFYLSHPKSKKYYADIRMFPLSTEKQEKSYKVLICDVLKFGLDRIVFEKTYKDKDVAINGAAFLLSSKFSGDV